MINEKIDLLSEILRRQTQVVEERRKKNTAMLLGSKFASDIEGADTIDKLSEIMFKANRQSYLAGVPELASQVNNLAQIKGMELKYTKEQLDAKKVAGLYGDTFGTMNVISGGDVVPFSSTKEFKDISSLPYELQPDAMKMVYQKMGAKIGENTVYNSSGGIDYVKYAADSQGNMKLIERLTPNKDGTYDNTLTPNFVEKLNEPLAVTMEKSKTREEKSKLLDQLAKQEEYLKYSHQLQLDTPFAGQLANGMPGIFSFKQDKQGRTYLVNLAGEDPTADITSQYAGKLGTAGRFSQFKNYNDFKIAQNKYEADVDNAAGNVRTILEQSFKSMPDSDLKGAVDKFNWGKERSSGFLLAQKNAIESYIKEQYDDIGQDNSEEAQGKKFQLQALQEALNQYDINNNSLKSLNLQAPAIENKKNDNLDTIKQDPFATPVYQNFQEPYPSVNPGIL